MLADASAEYWCSALSALTRRRIGRGGGPVGVRGEYALIGAPSTTRTAAEEAAAEVAQQAGERTARHLPSTRTAAMRAGKYADVAVSAVGGELDPCATGAARARAAMRGREGR